MNQCLRTTIALPRKAAFWLGSAVAAGSVLAIPAVASAASPELVDACNRFVASSPMSALPDDCKGVVSPVVFPSAGNGSTSTNSSVSSIVADTGAETPESPQAVANGDAAFLASANGQDLLAQASAIARGSRHIVVVMTPQLASQIAAGTLVNISTPGKGSFTLGQYCAMADGSLANVLAVAAGGGAVLLVLDGAGNVSSIDCLLPAAASHTQTSAQPIVITTIPPVTEPPVTGPVSAPGPMVY